MKTIRLLFALFIVCFATSAMAEEAKPAPGVEAAVDQGIKLLDAANYKGFLEAFVPPEQFKAITADGGAEKFAKSFGEGHAAKLLAVLKAIKGTKPTMEDDGKTATYKIPGDVGGGKENIVFKRVGTSWYIQN